MLILPHTAELNLASKPWVTWIVAVLCLLIHVAQVNSRDEVAAAAAVYCNDVFTDPAPEDEAAWSHAGECAGDMADLRSLPDANLFLYRFNDTARYFPDWGPEEIENYFQTLQTHYSAFVLTAPPSLDARLMYDPTVPNPWRMITSALAHDGWMHVIGNLIFFLAFAPVLELLAGRLRFIGIMILITAADSLVYSLATFVSGWPAPTLGLSGVVMGMIGLAAYVVPRVRIRTLVWFFIYIRNHSFPAWALAAWFIGWDVWYLLTKTDYGGVNLISHVSGGIAGYLTGMFLMRKQRDDYRDDIDDEIEHQRLKRSVLPGSHEGSNTGSYKRIGEGRRVRAAEAEYESLMEDVYTAVSTYQDNEAVVMLLRDYDLWADSPEVYEDIFHRIQQWGSSRTLFCIGRLLIHLYAQKGQVARAQAIARKCLEINPDFVLADRLDLGNMFHNTTDVQGQKMAEQLRENFR